MYRAYTVCSSVNLPLMFAPKVRKMLQKSARIYHQPHKKKEIKRGKKGSWRSKKCWCSTWKIRKRFLCKWKEQYQSSTICCTGKPLQVEMHNLDMPYYLGVDSVYMKSNHQIFFLPYICFCLKSSKRQCSFVLQSMSSVLPTLSVEWGRCCLWCGQWMLPLKMLSSRPTSVCISTHKETQ